MNMTDNIIIICKYYSYGDNMAIMNSFGHDNHEVKM